MGAVTPSPDDDEGLRREILETVVEPVLDELARDGIVYCGFLYVGLMLTADGPRVLEFNVRLGDPETQALLFAMEANLGEALQQAADGFLEVDDLSTGRAACCVVLASAGYPGSPETGHVMTGWDADFGPDVKVFHAGSGRNDAGELINAGGRVLGVTARAENAELARERAYAAVERISWPGMHYRRDIGA